MGTNEYQPRTPERLIEMLRAQSEQPRSWQREAANTIEYLLLRLAAKPADEGVRKAFKPFADWLENCGLDDFPDDHRITQDPGPQLTIGNLRRLAATLNPPGTGEPKPSPSLTDPSDMGFPR